MSESTAMMLVGTCGAGKSTLGNFLLHGVSNPAGGFKAAAGGEAVTTRCESLQDNSQRGSPFKVIDTPGIPDPNGKTKMYFDCIVEEARAVGSLNAVVFVMDYSVNRNDITRSLKNASILLEQFNKLGCTIVIACRVPGHLEGTTTLDVHIAERAWNSFVTEVADAAMIKHSATYFLGTAMKLTTRALRDGVTGCPDVPITRNSGMSTFDELKRCVENRKNNQTRREQLIKDVERLTRESQALRITVGRLQTANHLIYRLGRGLGQVWKGIITLSVSTAMLAEATAALVLSGSAAAATGVAVMSVVAMNHAISVKTVTIAENDVAVAAMSAELETGEVDVERLERDEETIRKLNELSR